jgi:hypothetical protein
MAAHEFDKEMNIDGKTEIRELAPENRRSIHQVDPAALPILSKVAIANRVVALNSVVILSEASIRSRMEKRSRRISVDTSLTTSRQSLF